jgi:hypothetical protein
MEFHEGLVGCNGISCEVGFNGSSWKWDLMEVHEDLVEFHEGLVGFNGISWGFSWI